MTRTTLLCCTMVAVLLMAPVAAMVHAAQYEASFDSWTAPKDLDLSGRDGDQLNVWSFTGGGSVPFPRYSVVEFELAPIRAALGVSPLTSVYLSLWQEALGSSDDNITLKQTAYILDGNGTTIDTPSLTWADLNTSIGAPTMELNATVLEMMGTLTIIGPAEELGSDGWVDSNASVLDIAKLQAVIDNTNRTQLTLILIADDDEVNPSRGTWGDGEAIGFNPQLFVNEPPEHFELGDFNKDGNITTADFDIMKANWLTLAGPAFNEDGEVTNDGLVTLADFAKFKNDLFPGGGAAFAAATGVPEPTTMLLLLAAIPASLLGRRRRIRS